MLRPDFIVNLNGFEGPLDLLLSLAKSQKVDLKKISILDLANQYLSFIDHARNQDLEIAADYLVMAAWLALIKSRLLLPEDDDNSLMDEISENLTLKIERLNYIRELGFRILNRERLGIDFFSIGNREYFERRVKVVFEASLVDLLRAYLRVSTKEDFAPFNANKIDIVSIESAIKNLKTYLSLKEEWITLDEIIRDSELQSSLSQKSFIASTFSASLELAKRGEIELDQSNLFDRLSFKLIL